MNTSAGGVTRNVCENLSRLGVSVKLISAVGTDVYADQIRRECQSAGIDISNLYVADGKASSTYMSMIDADGDMFGRALRYDGFAGPAPELSQRQAEPHSRRAARHVRPQSFGRGHLPPA